MDWSLVWFRELTVLGAYCYADEPGLGGRRTFDVMGEWLADPAFPVDGLVTHRFALDPLRRRPRDRAGRTGGGRRQGGPHPLTRRSS